jgi:hypothetical protein
MVNRTRNAGYVTDAAGGVATLDYVYDDVTLLMISVTIVNGTSQTAHLEAQSTANGRSYQTDVPPGQTQTTTIPGGAANRLQLTVTPNGRLDGVEYHFNLV